jgi:hypothetical protein
MHFYHQRPARAADAERWASQIAADTELSVKYDEVSKVAMQLTYRDKLRLALSLVQAACKEEEDLHPESRGAAPSSKSPDPDLVLYVAERLKKLKPSRKPAVLNSIGAMFQFRGGVSDSEKESFFAALIKKRLIAIGKNDRIEYPEAGEA